MKALRTMLPVVILPLAAPAAGQQRAAAAAPPTPAVDLSEAAALIDLARSAMRVYLTDRTPADRQGIPAAAAPMASSPYGVALTLRSKGVVVARSSHDRRHLARNVIVAALAAMRSPKLPDRVTRQVLDSLTIELEILGRGEPVSRADLPGAVNPGLTGVKFARGIDDSALLPSTAYLLGLTAEQIPRRCLAGLRASSESLSMPVRRTIFATKHFVGFPDGKTVWLYRGKILFPFDAIDDRMLAAAAWRVGAFLARQQNRAGRYTSPDAASSIADHLYATFAMARLARRTHREDFTASVRSAVQYSLARVGRDVDRYYVQGATPADRLAATAWMLRIISEIPADEKTAPLRMGLRAAIRYELGDRDRLLARVRAKPGADWVQGACAAIIAWAKATPPGSPDARLIAAAREVLGSLAPPSRAARLWMTLAAVPANRPATPLPAGRPPALDEAGGIGPPGRPPQTALTAWRVLNDAVALARGGRPAGARKLKAELDAGRRFCYRMMYHSPYEAYFAEDPESYLGGVRDCAAAAKVTLRACAAAIEAFLVEPSPGAAAAAWPGRVPRTRRRQGS